jgi:hypothetical protein
MGEFVLGIGELICFAAAYILVPVISFGRMSLNPDDRKLDNPPIVLPEFVGVLLGLALWVAVLAGVVWLFGG